MITDHKGKQHLHHHWVEVEEPFFNAQVHHRFGFSESQGALVEENDSEDQVVKAASRSDMLNRRVGVPQQVEDLR